MQIELNEIRLHAYHGVLDQERRVGNDFVVSLTATLDSMRGALTDELIDTVSYADMYAWVADEMCTPSRLLEHVVYRLMSRVFSESGLIAHLCIRLTKLNPPIVGDVPSASIALEMSREEWKSLRMKDLD